MLYCFLDTNILLQYKTFDEIDWLKEIEASEVTLVIVSTVFRELDKHKFDPNNSRRRERAKMLIRKLRPIIDTELTLRQRVYLKSALNASSDELIDAKYDPAMPDDQIIGTAELYPRPHSDDTIMVVTSDINSLITCKAHNLKCMSLPDSLLLPPQPDPLEKEIKELRAEILQLKNAQPKLEIGFRGEIEGRLNHVFELSVTLPKLSSGDIANLVNAKANELEFSRALDRQKLELSSLLDQEKKDKAHDTSSIMLSIGDLIKGSLESIQNSDSYIDKARYQTDLEIYLQLYRKYLQEKTIYDTGEYAKEINICILNSGTVPAVNVDIELLFSGNYTLTEYDPGMLKPPKEPPIPELQNKMNADLFRIFNHTTNYSFPRPNPIVPSVPVRSMITKIPSGYKASHNIGTLKHHHVRKLPTIWIRFDFDALLSKGFEIKYIITANNIADKMEGQLHIKTLINQT